MAERLPIPTITPTNDYPTPTPGFAGAVPDSANEAEWSPWTNMKGASTWYHVVKSSDDVFIEFDGKSNPPLVRGQGRFGRLGFTSKQFRIATKTAQNVRIAFGDVEDYDVNATGATGAGPDHTLPTQQLDPNIPFSIPADGEGTLAFSITTPASGTVVVTTIDGGAVKYRDLDGRVRELNTFPVSDSNSYIIDLVGTGGVIFEYFGPPGSFATIYSARISALAKPYVWARRFLGPSFNNVGGTPFAAGQVVQSGILKNFGLKTVSFRGIINGTPGDNVLVSFQPVKSDGSVYPGRPGYATIAVGKDFFISFDVETGALSYDVDGIGPGLPVAPQLATGAADLVVQVQGGANAWGLLEPEITHTVRA